MDYTEALKFLTSGTNLKWKDLLPSVPAQNTTETRLGKRKREEVAAYVQPSDSEVRTILKRHKIKVTDLGASHKARASGSKIQKDNFRLNPSPVTAFEHLRVRFNVRPSLAENLVDQEYFKPTEVQMAALPLLLDAEAVPNLLTVAPTGSGKTLAFMVPLIHSIMESRHKTGSNNREHHATALILAPTKELVSQIVNEGRKLSTKTGVSISAVRKGMQIAGSAQTTKSVSEDSRLDEGGESRHMSPPEVKSDILVSTPLALLRAMSSREDDYSTTLPYVRHLILDEADVLLDPLFRDQTLPVWKACVDPELQVSLWSATMGSNIEEVAMITMNEQRPAANPSKRRLLRCVVGLKDSAVSTITHRLICAGNEYGKLLGFRDILHPPPGLKDKKPNPSLPLLVYTQTIERAAALHSELEYDIPASAGGLGRVAVIHSNLSEKKRADVMKEFRSGKIWVLITTDLLSRGIDFHGVNGVVNYDIPNTTADYVHRAGRAGRAGREGGVVVTLWTEEDTKYLRGIANVIAASEKAKGGTWESVEGLRKWMFDGLPKVSKKERKELKQRGVQSRRGVRKGDDEKIIRAKRKSRIGTKSGYQIQKENNRRGAIKANKGKSKTEEVDGDASEWNGF